MKRIFFLGDTLDQICDFPPLIRNDAGAELRRVQMELEPVERKPVKTVGAGVREIRLRDAAGAYRVIYVLNAFQKKKQKTPKHELELAARRLKLI